ncbi:MAG: hypothetical protein QM743_08145 [Chitinophagaceae bacterium]
MSDLDRFDHLMEVVRKDIIAPEEHVLQLRESLLKRTYIAGFGICQTMGAIIDTGFRFTMKNYRSNY